MGFVDRCSFSRRSVTKQRIPKPFTAFLPKTPWPMSGDSANCPVRLVLDVGGASGYVADAFREVGARAITAEYNVDQTTEHGRQLTGGIIADGRALPIATGAVDVCYSSNVLEHVVSHEQMLSEMVRVVAPGGVIYLTFTNWLSPWGGHETSPWHYRGGEWAAQRFERVTGAPPKNRYGESLFLFEHRRSTSLVQFESQRQCARCVSPVLSPLD